MYPHNTEHANNDTEQLLAPDFDPDIDSNNQSVPASDALTQTNQHQQNTPQPIDANKSEPDTMQTKDNLPKTNWPDAPTIQIPRVSSTTPDQPPEVEYRERTAINTVQEQDVPELEEDEDKQEYIDDRYDRT